MSKTLYTKNLKDGKLITLSSPFDTRTKYLNIIYFVAFLFAGTTFLILIIRDDHPTVGLVLFILIIISIFYIAAFRFLNKTFLTEKIFINKHYILISKASIFYHQSHIYDIQYISNFRHLDKTNITKHPLAGNSFDYLGFQTEQQVIDDLHGDNRIAFEYNNKIITFGEKIYSWQFEQLIALLYNVTGRDYRQHQNI